MEVLCDFFEKVRNVFQWEDPYATKMFMIILIVVWVVLTFLPMRFIIFWALAWKFWKGRNWQKKRDTNNQEVCKVEFSNFLAQNHLIVPNYDEPWETLLKK